MEQDRSAKINSLEQSKKEIEKRLNDYFFMAVGSLIALAVTVGAGEFIRLTEGSVSNLEFFAEFSPFLPLVLASRLRKFTPHIS